MKTVPLVSYKGDIWRGIHKDILKIGIENKKTERGPPKHKRSIVFDTSEDFFKQYNRKSNHRYSMPGEVALYSAIGVNKNDAIKTIESEMKGADIENYHLEFFALKINKVFDLSDLETLKHLNIKRKQLLVRSLNDDAYILTHQLGHIANHMNIQAIKAESAERNGSLNIAVLVDNTRLNKL